MKPLLFVAAFILSSITTFAQRSDKYKVPYTSRCGLEINCYDCTDTVAKYKGNLKKLFSKEMNWRLLEQITGVIVLNIGVDEAGGVCLKEVYNYTMSGNSVILALNLGDLVNHMPAWKPAMKNRQPVSSVRTVAIYSFVKGHPIFDVEYIKSDKKIVWQPSKDLTEMRKTIGTSEVDNTFDPNKTKENNMQ